MIKNTTITDVVVLYIHTYRGIPPVGRGRKPTTTRMHCAALQLVLLIPFNKAQNGGRLVTNLVLTVWSEFLRPPETLGAGKKKLRTGLFGDF